MRANVSIRFALTSALVALLVAFATPRFANAADSTGWLLAGGGGCSCIDVYSQSGHHQPLKAQMNVGAFALSVDASQTLYAGQELRDGSYGVAVYPPGSKLPTREIDTPFVGGRATSLVVQADGTLYVGGDWGQLFEYLPGASQPAVSVVVAPSITGTLQGLSVDPRTNELYLSMNNQCCHLYTAILYRLSASPLRGSHRLHCTPHGTLATPSQPRR